MRVFPHAWNFSPLLAISLFAGAHLKTRRGMLILFGALLLSDAVLGFHATMAFTWSSFAIVLLMGKSLKPGEFSHRILFMSLAGSVCFYIITNLGVFLTSSMYPHTLSGLGECYLVAIPFFRNALVGNVVYSILIFGSYAWACQKYVMRSVPVKVKSTL